MGKTLRSAEIQEVSNICDDDDDDNDQEEEEEKREGGKGRKRKEKLGHEELLVEELALL